MERMWPALNNIKERHDTWGDALRSVREIECPARGSARSFAFPSIRHRARPPCPFSLDRKSTRLNSSHG